MTKQNVTILLWERGEIGREMADSFGPEVCHAHQATAGQVHLNLFSAHCTLLIDAQAFRFCLCWCACQQGRKCS